jgi:hypothetical protein
MGRLSMLAIVAGLSTVAFAACKLRDGSSTEKKTPSDPNSIISQEMDSTIDLSKTPIFVKCTAPKEAAQSFELTLRQDKASGIAGITYRHGDNEASAVSTTGRWDNFNEPNSYQFLYSFGELRLIMTQDQFAGGFYPATLVGVDAAKQYIEQNLMCSKF